MTSLYDAFDPSNFPYLIRYVDLPRDAVSIRRHRVAGALRRTGLVVVAVAALFVAGIGFASAYLPAAEGASYGNPVPGEFRLGPGNQQPPGIVISLDGSPIPSDPIPGDYRLGPGNQQPPGVSDPVSRRADVQWRPSLVPLR